MDVQHFCSLAEANEAITKWVSFYNFERTHMGLPQGMVPADRFLYGWNNMANIPVKAPVSNSKDAEAIQSADSKWEVVLKLLLAKLAG